MQATLAPLLAILLASVAVAGHGVFRQGSYADAIAAIRGRQRKLDAPA